MDENPTPEPPVVEAEIAEAGSSKATIVMNLEQLIKSHLTSIDRLEQEYRKQKEMLDDVFNNDATYKQHAEAAKEATKIKTATKQQILKQPQVADLNNKVKTMKSELAELQASLADYLQQFQQLSGINEIEDETGEVRQIVYTAKLVRKAFAQQ